MEKKVKPAEMNEAQPVEDSVMEQVGGGDGLFAHNLRYRPDKDKGKGKTLPSVPGEGELIKLSGGPLPLYPTDDKISNI